MQHKLKVFFIAIVAIFLVVAIKHFRSNHLKDHKAHYDISKVIHEENILPVAIIGSGPAGLTAALYVARAGIKAFVFAGPSPRGQLIETTFIDNWPGRQHVLGSELMGDIEAQAKSFGAVVVHDTVTKIDTNSWPFIIKTEDGRTLKAMSLIIATGATPRRLNIPGEQENFGKGVTTCAICDAPHFKGKEVVIAGGGDSAAEMVFELAPYVKKATILVRKDSMRAAASVQKRILDYPNVAIEYHKEIAEIYGDGEQVSAIDVYDNQTKQMQRRPIDGIFLAIGHDPNNKLLRGNLDLDEHGYVVMNGRSQQTCKQGIFAAGEIQDSAYRQAIVASGEGARAALDATSFLYEIGFSTEVAAQLEQGFFEDLSDEKVEIREIESEGEFNKLTWHGKGLVVVDFFSTQCPVCVRLLPVLESVAKKYQGKVTIIKTNYDKVKHTIFSSLWYPPSKEGKKSGKVRNLPTTEDRPSIKVRNLPTLLVFKDGKYMDMNTNFMTKTEFAQYLQKFM